MKEKRFLTHATQPPVNSQNSESKSADGIVSQVRESLKEIKKKGYGKFWKSNTPFASYKEVHEPPTVRVWTYLDDGQQTQGPFTSLEMD